MQVFRLRREPIRVLGELAQRFVAHLNMVPSATSVVLGSLLLPLLFHFLQSSTLYCKSSRAIFSLYHQSHLFRLFILGLNSLAELRLTVPPSLELRPQVRPPKTCTYTHRNKKPSLRLARLWQDLHTNKRTHRAPSNAHWRETTCVQYLLKELLRCDTPMPRHAAIISYILLTGLQSSSLARHRKIHSNQRPYPCKAGDCNKRYIPRTWLFYTQVLTPY